MRHWRGGEASGGMHAITVERRQGRVSVHAARAAVLTFIVWKSVSSCWWCLISCSASFSFARRIASHSRHHVLKPPIRLLRLTWSAGVGLTIVRAADRMIML